MNTNGLIKNPVIGNLTNITGENFLEKALPSAVTLALIIGTIVFLFMLITGAIAWISSGGDKQSLETSKTRITSALTGIVILFAVFAIIQVVEIFFGINILTLDIEPLKIQ